MTRGDVFSPLSPVEARKWPRSMCVKETMPMESIIEEREDRLFERMVLRSISVHIFNFKQKKRIKL